MSRRSSAYTRALYAAAAVVGRARRRVTCATLTSTLALTAVCCEDQVVPDNGPSVDILTARDTEPDAVNHDGGQDITPPDDTRMDTTADLEPPDVAPDQVDVIDPPEVTDLSPPDTIEPDALPDAEDMVADVEPDLPPVDCVDPTGSLDWRCCDERAWPTEIPACDVCQDLDPFACCGEVWRLADQVCQQEAREDQGACYAAIDPVNFDATCAAVGPPAPPTAWAWTLDMLLQLEHASV